MHDQATAEFALACELSSTEQLFDAVRNRAWAHSIAGQQDQEMMCLTEMLSINPDCRATRMRHAITRGHLKDLPGAIDDITETVERHGPNADTHTLLGHAHRALAFHHRDDRQDLKTAQQHMQQAIFNLEMAIEYEEARPQAFIALTQTNACCDLFDLDED